MEPSGMSRKSQAAAKPSDGEQDSYRVDESAEEGPDA